MSYEAKTSRISSKEVNVRRRLEPQWRPIWRYHNSVPAGLKNWLFDSGSTTKRLQQTQLSFRIRIIKQCYQRLRYTEKMSLGLKETATWVREVQLFYDEKPWLYARAVFPTTLLTDKVGWKLKRLGNYSLGELLFHLSGLRRSKFVLACLRPGHVEFEDALKGLTKIPSQLWARRSLFYIEDKSLLLTEVFLPHPMFEG